MLEPFAEIARDDARARILAIGQDYETEVEASRNAPRLAELRSELHAIAERARAAEEALEAVRGAVSNASPWARDVITGEDFLSLNVRPRSPIDADPLDAIRIEAGLMDAEWTATPDDPFDRWFRNMQEAKAAAGLDALARLIDALLAEIPKDRGGGGNVYTDRWGGPKWCIAEQGYHLFALCRPRDTSPIDGPLFDFVGSLMEWASIGHHRAETIRPFLQRVAVWERRQDEIRAELAGIYQRLAAGDLSSDEEQRANARLIALQHQLNRHMPRRLRKRSENNPPPLFENNPADRGCTRSLAASGPASSVRVHATKPERPWPDWPTPKGANRNTPAAFPGWRLGGGGREGPCGAVLGGSEAGLHHLSRVRSPAAPFLADQAASSPFRNRLPSLPRGALDQRPLGPGEPECQHLTSILPFGQPRPPPRALLLGHGGTVSQKKLSRLTENR